MTQNDSETSKDDLMPDNGKKSSKQYPVFENNRMDIAGWINSDKNGNAYISVKIGLLDTYIQLYPSNERIEAVLENFRQVVKENDLAEPEDDS